MEACSSCVKQLKCYDSELNSINITEGYSMPNSRTCFSPTSNAPYTVLLVLKGTSVCASGMPFCHHNVGIFHLVLCKVIKWISYSVTFYNSEKRHLPPSLCLSVCLSVRISIRLKHGVGTAWIFRKFIIKNLSNICLDIRNFINVWDEYRYVTWRHVCTLMMKYCLVFLKLEMLQTNVFRKSRYKFFVWKKML